MLSPLIGQIFGHYRILDQLGAGGMGVVYRAQDQRLGRLVALKVLPTATAHDDEAVERFRREARTASSLSHPNICTIYSFDEIDGQLVLAMELLDGETLDRRLAGRPLDLGGLLDLGEHIADALDAAHSEGVLHRDIKPANIFITRRGQAKVLDFGLAKLAPDFRRLDHHAGQETHAAAHFSSIAGTTVGTIAYMSPEQARGEDLDARTDLFSYGVVLYEMATGRQGFPGHTTAVIFDGILNREPKPPSMVNTSLPAELDRIISKALEKDRHMRYQTAADMRSDLRRLRRDSGSRRIAVPVFDADPNAATVVLPPGGGASATETAEFVREASVASSAAPAAALSVPVTPVSTVASPPASVSSSRRSGNVVALAAGAVAVLLIGGAVAVYFARSGDAVEGAAVGVAPPVASPEAAPAAPTLAAQTPSAPVDPVEGVPSPTSPSPPTAAPSGVPVPSAKTAGADASATSGGRPRADRGANARSVAPAPVDPPSTPVETSPAPKAEDNAIAERMAIAKAKLASNLRDQAIGDLRQIVIDYPSSSTAADAALMVAEELEKLNRVEDAMGAHVEFANRFRSDPRLAQSRLQLAALTLKSRRQDREASTREILGSVARDFPKTPAAQEALQRKLQLETSNRRKEKDPVLGIEVPVALPTLRALAEQFPEAPATMLALNRLAMLYTDLDQYERAAQALTELATRFPANPHDAWFRLGELYERNLRDPDRARAAYAQVPSTSGRYRDAQKRANRR